MRIEFIIPVLAGLLAALIGIGLIYDAWTPDQVLFTAERRRRERAERNRRGEAALGFGVLCMAAAFIGRDIWRYSVVAVIVGTVLLVYGAVANWRYLGEVIVNRGPMRRSEPGSGARETGGPSADAQGIDTADPGAAEAVNDATAEPVRPVERDRIR